MPLFVTSLHHNGLLRQTCTGQITFLSKTKLKTRTDGILRGRAKAALDLSHHPSAAHGSSAHASGGCVPKMEHTNVRRRVLPVQ